MTSDWPCARAALRPCEDCRVAWVVVLLSLLIIGCSAPTASPAVATIGISAPRTTLARFEVLQLTAIVQGKDGKTLTDRALTWRSSNPSVARVSPTGLVTAGSVLGGTTERVIITAEAQGVTGYVQLAVESPPQPHPRWVRDTTWNESNTGMTLVYESEISGGTTFRKPWTFAEVTDTTEAVRAGWKAQRFETRSGDCFGTDCFRTPVYERNEFAQAGGENLEGDEYWYAWSFYVPANLVPASWVYYGQFQQHSNYDSIWMFMKRAGQPFCAVFDPARTQNWNCTLQNHVLIQDWNFDGRWHDILVHARWTTSDQGFTRIYVDGALMVDYTGYTRTSGNVDVYFKYGIYRHASSVSSVIYYDEIRRGRRREDVDLRLFAP